MVSIWFGQTKSQSESDGSGFDLLSTEEAFGMSKVVLVGSVKVLVMPNAVLVMSLSPLVMFGWRSHRAAAVLLALDLRP